MNVGYFAFDDKSVKNNPTIQFYGVV